MTGTRRWTTRGGILFGKPIRYTLGSRRYASQVSPTSNIPGTDQDEDDDKSSKNAKSKWSGSRFGSTLFKVFETAATTFASIAILGLAGYSYHMYYKELVLQKMEMAFTPGDPMLDMASPPGAHESVQLDDETEHWVDRPEQTKIDSIINGEAKGRYFLLVGEKGTGKSTMVLEAMRKIDGEGVSMFEAHADPEIVRIRLGKALNYDFHEDYIGSLFSIRGPRDTTALLDIERAFNKLEKIALAHRNGSRLRSKRKGPLVLVVNCAHLIRNDKDGNDLIELLQQRAEQWAASNLVTMIFNSDDYWVYERLKRFATRMEVIQVLDLPRSRAIAALGRYRARYFPQQKRDPEVLKQVYDLVGGRLNFLSRVAKSRDMLRMCHRICEAEKTWFLNQCGILGESMDDDVMDQQKYASAAMVLAKALVEKEKEMELRYDEHKGHILPQIPLYIARQIMTRADFIQQYDHDNIFTIDSTAMVRPDSVPMMNAFKDICSEDGFDKYLQDTLDRISAIESINRTKELTFKDLWTEQSGEQKGKYTFLTKDHKGRETGTIEMRVQPDQSPED
ncbi:hypothetical protein LTR10_016869 [Elasticomyces elasticus]|uniref:Orc1-like AAA ATPase domain-containing protein n=1 Tax=Exophiala sideris TaxID=1016849 RepID=A0ABR0JKN1_9EURO|nr:hypothetical protein LTR10_016869 [Elasticomyces elasticus]KAK5035361.1 hypothetical protein LTS07_002798 [Exophiala sideris]KAK5039288.1 hypothetical protein LTR13_003544 [Exophiala sideris]KAK5066285.1 hypothetical protein LTR69_002804 [Exophiala sideris]KAK5186962.1 hypothetical protein LTR44_000969 [Eurotiomycetes sp. CCFEE 6388]